MHSLAVRDPVGDHLLAPNRTGYLGVRRAGTEAAVSPIQPGDGTAIIGAVGQEVMQRAGPPGQRDLVVAA